MLDNYLGANQNKLFAQNHLDHHLFSFQLQQVDFRVSRDEGWQRAITTMWDGAQDKQVVDRGEN